MVAKARFSTVLVLLYLAVLFLQGGCNVSDDAGGPGGGQPSDNIRLTSSTPGDVRVLVADGQDSIPIRVTVTDNIGNGRAGVPVTFVTSAGTLSRAPTAPRAERASSPDGSIAVPQQEAGEPLTVNTNANGVAEVILTSSTTAEIATVTASVPDGFRTSVSIAFVIPVGGIDLSARPRQVERNATATIEAIVRDVSGDPVEDETVTFTIATNTSGATLSSDTAITDTNGRASVTYTAGSTLGMDILTATTADRTAGRVTITVVASRVTAIAVTAGATSVVADGVSRVHIEATVTDAEEIGVPGVEVTFTTTAGSLSSAMDTTNADGVATVDLIAGTNLGTATVTATAGGFNATAMVSFVAGAPTTVLLGASRVTLDVGQTSTIQATVTDANDNPTVDERLTFSFSQNSSGGSLSALTGTTDADGRVTVTYRAGNTFGTDIIQAEATNGTARGTVTLTVTDDTTPRPNDRLTVTPNPGSIPADGTSMSTITALLVNANNNPIIGALINFRTNLGSIDATGVTDDTGRATVRLFSTTRRATARVTASFGSLSATTAVTFVAPPPGNVASIDLTPSATTIPANGSANIDITARLRDTSGAPVSDGTIVTFATNLGAITGQDATTDGVATATFTAGTVAGNATVTATAGTAATGIVTSSVVITLEAGPVASIVLVDVSTTVIGVRGSGTNDTSNLTFEARDNNGNLVQDPVPGAPTTGTRVTFTLEDGGVGGGEEVSPLAATAVNGRVTTTLRSGTLAGIVRAVAFIDANGNGSLNAGEIASEAVSVVITGGSPWGENLSVVPEVLNIAGLVTFGLTDAITTFVSDRFSNPVPDGTGVFFFSDFAGITGAATTDSAGGTMASTAVATLTSQGPLPPDGFVTVSASTQSGAEARVLTFAVDPTNPALVYAGTDGGGVFRTSNGLATGPQVAWEQLGSPRLLDSRVIEFTSGIVRDLQIDPSDNSILYAATDTGVFRSTGGGDSWSERSGRERVEGQLLGTLEEDPLRPGFFQPLDLPFPSNGSRARTVVQINGQETTFYLYLGPETIDILPGAGNIGDLVTISYDLGASIPGGFRTTAIALDPTDIADPLTERTLYASTRGAGVFASRDGSFSWRAINNDLTNFDVLALLALSPDTLYAGTFGGGVFRTFNAIDDAPVWCRVNTGLRASSVINTLATDGTRVYAGTLLGGVAILEDATPLAGETDCRRATAPTWISPTRNVNADDVLNTFVSDIVIDPNTPTTLYAATLGDGTRTAEGNSAQGGIYISRDSGDTWDRIPPLPDGDLALPPADLPDNRAYALGLPADPTSDIVYIGTAGRNVVRLTPSTATFEGINGTPNNALTNNIFDSTTVLFSGNTRVTITQVSDSFRDEDRGRFGPLPDGTIFNGGSQNFLYTVSDRNGNPITGGSTVEVTLDPEDAGAELIGDTNFTIPDTQRGSTDFAFTVLNNRDEEENATVAVTINVTSAPNGNVTAAVSRTIIGPVTIVALTGTTIPGTGTGPTGFQFTVIGGSETPAFPPIAGGYAISDPAFGDVDRNIISFGEIFTLITDASAQGQTFTLSVQDRVTGQRATIEITQEETPPVVISPSAPPPLPAGGGRVTFRVTGGSGTIYDITTTAGTVNPTRVAAGGTFTLVTDAGLDGTTITVTATDLVTNQESTATVQQEEQ